MTISFAKYLTNVKITNTFVAHKISIFLKSIAHIWAIFLVMEKYPPEVLIRACWFFFKCKWQGLIYLAEKIKLFSFRWVHSMHENIMKNFHIILFLCFSAHESWCGQNFSQSIGCKSGRNGKEWYEQTEIIGNEIEFGNHFQVCPKGMCRHLMECVECI